MHLTGLSPFLVLAPKYFEQENTVEHKEKHVVTLWGQG